MNAAGSVTVGDRAQFWAAPSSAAANSADAVCRTRSRPTISPSAAKARPDENTTLAVVATDAKLSKPQCHRLAVMAQTGLARAIYPVHTPLDGDVVFAAATGEKPLSDPIYGLSELGTLAAAVLARAIARGVYEATALPFPGALPGWKDKFR